MAVSLETFGRPTATLRLRPALTRLARANVETLSLIASLGWCYVLATVPAFFARTHSFDVMSQLATQAHWSLIIGVGSVVQAVGIASGQPRLQLLSSVTGAAWWTFVAVMISTAGVTTGLAVYLPLAVMLALRTLRHPENHRGSDR